VGFALGLVKIFFILRLLALIFLEKEIGDMLSLLQTICHLPIHIPATTMVTRKLERRGFYLENLFLNPFQPKTSYKHT
jgi:hypothetical protein